MEKKKKRRRRRNDSNARMTAHDQMGQELNGNTELENDSDKLSSLLTQSSGPSKSLNKYTVSKCLSNSKSKGRAPYDDFSLLMFSVLFI